MEKGMTLIVETKSDIELVRHYYVKVTTIEHGFMIIEFLNGSYMYYPVKNLLSFRYDNNHHSIFSERIEIYV